MIAVRTFIFLVAIAAAVVIIMGRVTNTSCYRIAEAIDVAGDCR